MSRTREIAGARIRVSVGWALGLAMWVSAGSPYGALPGAALIVIGLAWLRFRLSDVEGPIYIRPAYLDMLLILVAASSIILTAILVIAGVT